MNPNLPWCVPHSVPITIEIDWKWVKCSDKLPEVGKLFLFIDEKNTYCLGKYVYKQIFDNMSQTWVQAKEQEFEIEHMSCGCCEEDFNPTHWIELSDPPSEEK